ncbi:ABC transporter substrate-binding protein [Bradyrhizobium sp. TZ2]
MGCLVHLRRHRTGNDDQVYDGLAKTQGSDAAFFYAKDNGYFKEEGLNVVIDQGEGSGATVTRSCRAPTTPGFGATTPSSRTHRPSRRTRLSWSI